MQTRQQKIEFLNGLAKGKRKLYELTDDSLLMLYETGEETGLFTAFAEGKLPKQLENNRGVVNQSQIDRYAALHPRVQILLFVRQPGYESLNTSLLDNPTTKE